MDELIASIRAEVEANGHQIVIVLGEDEMPPHAFTVGLTRAFGHPELIVVGLDDGEPEGAMHELLEAAAEMIDGGARFEVGTTTQELLEGHSIAIRAVSPSRTVELLAVAREVLGAEVDAVQLVWPDRRGLMPWSPACDVRVRERQPMLDGV